ncbi:MAG: hypothetical protein DHS20C08_08760 [Rhodomicrobium sp.]|nr:MAG: hypothetical protein DHS20C08_08760 [Rhodomicrobium sp.]
MWSSRRKRLPRSRRLLIWACPLAAMRLATIRGKCLTPVIMATKSGRIRRKVNPFKS